METWFWEDKVVKSDFTQSAMTFETPFSIRGDGIYRGEKQWLKAGEDVSIKTATAICDALNRAYQSGFQDASDLILNKECRKCNPSSF